MRVLVVGSGGREHALCWRLSLSPTVTKLFCLPGNPGTAACADNIAGDPLAAARDQRIDLVVVGPEQPLIEGLADQLRAAGIAAFGPGVAGARLEADKAYAKAEMRRMRVPTADFHVCADLPEAKAIAHAMFGEGKKVVVKASGQALGKGVAVCDTVEEANEAIEDCLVRKAFGQSGETIVIEERLHGEELSLFSLRSGGQGIALPPIRDYKRVGDGGTGPNTGGMGARTLHGVYSPERVTDWHDLFCNRIGDDLKYTGTLFAGLMVTPEGPMCLEYNCRFGDPETQALARVVDADWAPLLYGLARNEPIAPPPPGVPVHCVAITLASGGYPGGYNKGLVISGLEHAAMVEGVTVFHAGTRSEEGGLVTNGGRVLTVTATGPDLEIARGRAYEAATLISFQGKHYRSDIGR